MNTNTQRNVSRVVNKARQSTGPNNPEPIGKMSEETAENVVEAPKVGGFFGSIAREMSKAGAERVTLVQTAKQKLAEAADLYREGGEKSGEADAVAQSGMVSLYRARSAGYLTVTDMNATLGDVFGYKAKGKSGIKTPLPAGHPEAGKTPFGKGEDIRKRIVRLVAAREFVDQTGELGGSYFDGLDPTMTGKEETRTEGLTIADVLKSMDDGDFSPTTAYEYIGEIVRDNRDARPPRHFDPKLIAAVVEGLTKDPKATETIAKSDALKAAYVALFDWMLLQK